MLKRLFYILLTSILTINIVNAEQWLYIYGKNSAQLDIDSLRLDGDNLYFNLKDEYYTNNGIYVHKMVYDYATDKFAVLESTKYAAWRDTNNIVSVQKFDNPEYKTIAKDSLLENIKSILGSKENIRYLKGYISTQEIKFNKKVKNLKGKEPNTSVLFWIDGDGNIISYDFLYGNFPNSSNNQAITESNTCLLKYLIEITSGKTRGIIIQKCSFDTVNKNGFCSAGSETIAPHLFMGSRVRGSYARTAYDATLASGYTPEKLGTVSNTEFYNKYIDLITNRQVSDRDKKIQIQILAQQLVNNNKELFSKIDKIKKFDKLSDKYQKGHIGIILRIR